MAVSVAVTNESEKLAIDSPFHSKTEVKSVKKKPSDDPSSSFNLNSANPPPIRFSCESLKFSKDSLYVIIPHLASEAPESSFNLISDLLYALIVWSVE